MNSLKCDIVTPERLMFSGEVDQVDVPGETGDFGVLVNHCALISLIRPGVVSIKLQGGISENIFVDSGLAEVNSQACTILAERAVKVSELGEENIAAAKKSGNDALVSAIEDAIKNFK